MHILVVEDEQRLARLLRRVLSEEHHTVDLVYDGVDGLNTISATVDNVEYAGRESLIDVVTSSGLRLIVRTSVPVQVGEQVRVSAPVERTLVYPSE